MIRHYSKPFAAVAPAAAVAAPAAAVVVVIIQICLVMNRQMTDIDVM